MKLKCVREKFLSVHSSCNNGRVVATETIWPEKKLVFTFWPFREKV